MSRHAQPPTSPGLDVIERVPRPYAYRSSDSAWRVRCRHCKREYVGQRQAITKARGCIACRNERCSRKAVAP